MVSWQGCADEAWRRRRGLYREDNREDRAEDNCKDNGKVDSEDDEDGLL